MEFINTPGIYAHLPYVHNLLMENTRIQYPKMALDRK